MKEILFRGQTRRFGEKRKNVAGDKMPSNWVYGGICKGDGDYSIIYGSNAFPDLRLCDKYMVYTDTVGQYIGVEDKNGKKVFEGDVVTFFDEGSYVQAVVRYDNDRLSFVFVCQFSLYLFSDVLELYEYGISDKFEIIGNIYDNPELVNWEVDFIENK